jgi:hypothetical protein
MTPLSPREDWAAPAPNEAAVRQGLSGRAARLGLRMLLLHLQHAPLGEAADCVRSAAALLPLLLDRWQVRAAGAAGARCLRCAPRLRLGCGGAARQISGCVEGTAALHLRLRAAALMGGIDRLRALHLHLRAAAPMGGLRRGCIDRLKALGYERASACRRRKQTTSVFSRFCAGRVGCPCNRGIYRRSNSRWRATGGVPLAHGLAPPATVCDRVSVYVRLSDALRKPRFVEGCVSASVCQQDASRDRLHLALAALVMVKEQLAAAAGSPAATPMPDYAHRHQLACRWESLGAYRSCCEDRSRCAPACLEVACGRARAPQRALLSSSARSKRSARPHMQAHGCKAALCLSVRPPARPPVRPYGRWVQMAVIGRLAVRWALPKRDQMSYSR